MSELERRQRALLALLKQRPVADCNDPRLKRVAASRELEMLREIALWWRRFQIEAVCRSTSRLLKKLGRFHAEVAAYFAANATSPFIEDLADGFLEYLSGDENADVASLASLERDALFGVEARIP